MKINFSDVDKLSNLIAHRLKDKEPGPTMALAFLSRGVFALLKIGMTRKNILDTTEGLLNRFDGGSHIIQMPSSDDLKNVVKDVLKKH